MKKLILSLALVVSSLVTNMQAQSLVNTNSLQTTTWGQLAVTALTAGTIAQSGALTVPSIAVTNNATVGGTLGVTGASTLTGNVAASGALAVTGAATFSTNATVSGNLAVTGTSAITGAATFSTNVTVSGNLAVTGTSILTGAVSHPGGLSVGIGGPTLLTWLTGSANIDFTSISANTIQTSNITVTGAGTNSTVLLNVVAPNTGLSYTALVSATNTVTVRAANVTVGAIDPAVSGFIVDVINR